MIIIISYSYLITTTYYLSKHPTCKKNHLIKSFDSVAKQRKKNPFFLALWFFCPYSILDIHGSLFKFSQFQKIKTKKIDTNVFRLWFFFNQHATSTAKTKKNNICHQKKINPTLALTLPNLNNLAVLTLKMWVCKMMFKKIWWCLIVVDEWWFEKKKTFEKKIKFQKKWTLFCLAVLLTYLMSTT